MSADNGFTKRNLDDYLRELAKEYRKLNGKTIPAEIILIGGAAILTNYGFREMTYDIDAIIHAASSMKDAINHVGDRFNLPNGWLNTDFIKTDSYTPKLNQYSIYYKTFSNILTVRTVSNEYLIAMKLRSGRKYKSDLSDVIGIIHEHYKQNNPITMSQIKTAIANLYGSPDAIPHDSAAFLEAIFASSDFESLYQKYRVEELENKALLLELNEDYPNAVNQNNISELLNIIKARKNTTKKAL